MLRATQVRPAGPLMNGPYETISLDHTARHRRRMVMKADGGLSFLLDLEQAQVAFYPGNFNSMCFVF